MFRYHKALWLLLAFQALLVAFAFGMITGRDLRLDLPPAVAAKLVASASLSTPGKLCSFAALAFACASLAHFLDFAQGKGEIFRFWRAWTFRQFWFKGRAKRTRTFDHYHRNQDVPFGAPADVVRCWSPVRWQPASHVRQGLYKILGGCIYCASVWLGSAFYVTGAAFLAVPFWLIAWGWPLFVGVQFVLIDVLFLLHPNEETTSYPGPVLKDVRAHYQAEKETDYFGGASRQA